MHVNTHADVDVVAVETDDQVTVMLELEAPATTGGRPRPAATVEIVLDRSGSMRGERLDAAKDALLRLVDRLDPADRFGVVAFDDMIEVVVPAGRLADKPAAPCLAASPRRLNALQSSAGKSIPGTRAVRNATGNAFSASARRKAW